MAERADAVVPPTEVMPRLGDTWLRGGTVAVVRLMELTMVSGGGFVPAAGTPGSRRKNMREGGKESRGCRCTQGNNDTNCDT